MEAPSDRRNTVSPRSCRAAQGMLTYRSVLCGQSRVDQPISLRGSHGCGPDVALRFGAHVSDLPAGTAFLHR